MRIGIDVRMMDSNFGLGRYIQQLVKYLAQLNAQTEYVFFFRSKEQMERNATQLGRLPGNIRCVYGDIPWYGWREQVLFPFLLRKESIDLMHFPHWNVPFLYRRPFLLTMHDLTMFHFPRPDATTLGPLWFWIKDTLSRIIIRSAARRAKHIITTTEFTKHDIHKTLNIPLKKMITIYQAPFVGGNSQQPTANSQETVLDLPKPYMLYVGAAYPHKNLNGLLRAWQQYTREYNNDHLLVLAGSHDSFYARLLESNIFKEANNVLYLGKVTDTTLEHLYAQAAAYVFPSLYEGFGLPPLEAMVYDVPVLSSNRSCLPEILGDAALYVDPENSAQFAQAIDRILHDADIRQELKEKGREQIALYSWRWLAQATHDVYQDCLESV